VRHDVDSYFTRDRSYRTARPELGHPIAPQTWGAAVFGDDLAFHFVGADGDDLSASNLRWGYVWRDGELHAPVRMRKRTIRGDDGVRPVGSEIEIEESGGLRHVMRGTVVALLPMCFWPNMVTHLGLTRYELNGRTGYGDYQDIVFGQTLREVAAAREGTST
jgi:hypothetical protein